VHSLTILLIVAVSIPCVVFVIALLMSKAGDWAWRSERNRGRAMLATGALYLALAGVLLLGGEAWPKWVFFITAGAVSIAAGSLVLVRGGEGAVSPSQ